MGVRCRTGQARGQDAVLPLVKCSTLVVGVSGAGRLASRYAAMLEGSTRVVDLSSGLYWRALLRMRGIIGMSPDVYYKRLYGFYCGKI